MNLHRRLLGGVVIAAAATTLAIPVTAGASAGDRTFQATYPIASRVCANVAAGTERKGLKRFATTVLADCQALQREFTAAQTTVLAARAVLTPQIAADRAAILAVCPTPTDAQPVCVQVRDARHAALVVLQRQRVHAARRYYRTVEAARDRFWNAIRALPGESRIPADAPIPIQNS